MMRCKDCRFWNKNGEEYERGTWDENTLDWIEVQTHARRCLKVIHGNKGDNLNLDKEEAFLTDGSGYAASLWTTPTFSCSLFKKKER